ncbi:MAG: hypothetical protein IK085_10540 [Clostridia bacterium]|nr:hypothetical protein [Clostridia bacterium]
MKHSVILKKAICLLLCVSTVFLFASCSKSGNSEAETETETQAVTTVQLRDKVKADGFLPSMMPEGFPDTLPMGITCKTQAKYFADEETYGYKTDFYRLRLSGDATAFSSLSTVLRGNGWVGGCEEYESDSKGSANEQTAGRLQGYWSNKKYICLIAECDYNEESTEYTVSLDVYENSFVFPESVEKYFPAFNAPNLGDAEILVFTKNGKPIKEYSSIDSYKWRCDCNRKSFFVGIDFNTFDKYVTALSDAGFILTQSDRSDDHGDFCIIQASKVVNGKTYYAIFTYVDYLKTVSCEYMNDLDFFNKYDV